MEAKKKIQDKTGDESRWKKTKYKDIMFEWLYVCCCCCWSCLKGGGRNQEKKTLKF